MATEPSELISQYNSLTEKRKQLKKEYKNQELVAIDQHRLAIAEQIGDQDLVFDSYWSLIEAYINIGDQDGAIECAEIGLTQAQEWNNHKEAQSLLLLLSGEHLYRQDIYADGSDYWDRFIQNEKDYGNDCGLKASLQRIKKRADIYIYDFFDPIIQELKEMERYEEGIEVSKGLQSISLEENDLINYVTGLALEFDFLEKSNRSDQLNEVAQKIENVLNQEDPDASYPGSIYLQLGIFYKEQGKLAEALNIFKKWESDCQQTNDFEEISATYYYQGMILKEQKEFDLAINTLKKAQEITSRHHLEETEKKIRELLAEINKETKRVTQQKKKNDNEKDYDSAKIALEKGLALEDDIDYDSIKQLRYCEDKFSQFTSKKEFKQDKSENNAVDENEDTQPVETVRKKTTPRPRLPEELKRKLISEAILLQKQGNEFVAKKVFYKAYEALSAARKLAKDSGDEALLNQIREDINEYSRKFNEEYNRKLISEAILLQKQANEFVAKKEYYKAWEPFKKAKKLAKESGDEALLNQIKEDENELTRKVDEFRRRNQINEATALQKQGNALWAKKDYYNARETYKKARKLAKDNGDETLLSKIKADEYELNRQYREWLKANPANIEINKISNPIIEEKVEIIEEVVEEKDHSFRDKIIGYAAAIVGAIVIIYIVYLIFVNSENFTVKLCSGGFLAAVGYGIYVAIFKRE